jgi:hypothetical protein
VARKAGAIAIVSSSQDDALDGGTGSDDSDLSGSRTRTSTEKDDGAGEQPLSLLARHDEQVHFRH